MKKSYFFLSVLAMAIVLVSCDKAAEILFKSFEAPINFNISIDPAIAGLQSNLGTSTVSYDLDAEVRKATSDQFNGSIIKQMYVKTIDIKLNNADQANNLSNFETLTIKFGTNPSDTVVLGPFVIPSSAYANHTIPVPNCPNIRPFFNGANVNFVVSGKAKTSTNKVLNAAVTANLTFDK